MQKIKPAFLSAAAIAGVFLLSACASPSNEQGAQKPQTTITSAESIAAPEQALVVVYMHGTTRPQRRENCALKRNKPPASILRLGQSAGAYIYTFCSKATDGGVGGSYIYKRVDELARVLADLIGAGVKPKNIFLSGHSAGAWTALMAAHRLDTSYNGAILFAPACCGPRFEAKIYPVWRNRIRPLQVRTMLQAEDIKALVFAYEDDAFNRPKELEFLTKHSANDVEMVGYSCGAGHATYRLDCREEETHQKILSYLKEMRG